MSPVEVDMEYRHTKGSTGVRSFDLTNCIGAAKSIFDSMIDAGIIPNDSNRWFALGRVNLITKKLTDGRAEGVYLTVRKQ